VPASTTTGGGRRLAATESVSLHLSSEYVAELGSGDNWEDFRLSKNEIASDPEAAALAAYFKQVRRGAWAAGRRAHTRAVA
jgi:hypothetical protein